MESPKLTVALSLPILIKRIKSHHLQMIHHPADELLTTALVNRQQQIQEDMLLQQVFQTLHQVTLLLGDSGAGKTRLFQHLARDCWTHPERYASYFTKPVLPLFLSLANWQGSLDELIENYMINCVGLDTEDIQALQQQVVCILFLDAYDLTKGYPALQSSQSEWSIKISPGELPRRLFGAKRAL